MAYIDLLFAGVPKSPVRSFLADAVKRHKPYVVVIPCTGSFALAETAISAGLRADRVVTGDISLYSTVIGEMLAGRDMPLEAIGEGERVAKYIADPVSKAAAVLYMIRWCQTKPKADNRTYWRDRLRDLEIGVDDYISRLIVDLTALKSRIGGVRYDARDLWETVGEFQDRGDAMIWLDPPWYAKGYDKMFRGLDRCFVWDAPKVPQFDPKQYTSLMSRMAESVSRTYVLYPSGGDDPAKEFKLPWRSAFGLKIGSGHSAGTIWAMCNKPDSASISGNTLPRKAGERFPIFEGDISPEMTLEGRPVSDESGDYYRDLLVKNLRSGGVECHAALLLDGKLISIIGVHNIQNIFIGGPDQRSVHVVFHFPIHHPDYPRLSKLMMLCITSAWFWRDVLLRAYTKLEVIGLPYEVQTTILTDKPSSMLVRGTPLKLVKREFDKKLGKNLLNYRGAMTERTREETLALWLTKYAT